MTPTVPSKWTAGGSRLIVAGSLLALIAVAMIVVGAYGLWLHTTQRSDGYVMTSSERFSTGKYALATRTLHLSSDVPGFLYGRDWLGDVGIRGDSANPARPLFIFASLAAGRATPAQAEEARAHLAACPSCRTAYETFTRLHPSA